MLADARHPDRILALEGAVELFDDVLGLQLFALHVAEGVLLAPALDVGQPIALIRDALGIPRLDNSLAQGGQRALEVAEQGHVSTTILGDFCRVDIEMDHLGARCKGIEFARHTVVKTRTNRDQKIRTMDCPVGVFRTVHTRHLHRQRVRVGERALSEQGRRDGSLQRLGKEDQIL